MDVINYRCERCNKNVKAKISRTQFKKNKDYHDSNRGYHNRLDCTECGKYIKYIGEQELREIKIKYADNILDDLQDRPHRPEDDLSEISFKLDLILDHLGIISEPPIEGFRLGSDRWEK